MVFSFPGNSRSNGGNSKPGRGKKRKDPPGTDTKTPDPFRSAWNDSLMPITNENGHSEQQQAVGDLSKGFYAKQPSGGTSTIAHWKIEFSPVWKSVSKTNENCNTESISGIPDAVPESIENGNEALFPTIEEQAIWILKALRHRPVHSENRNPGSKLPDGAAVNVLPRGFWTKSAIGQEPVDDLREPVGTSIKNVNESTFTTLPIFIDEYRERKSDLDRLDCVLGALSRCPDVYSPGNSEFRAWIIQDGKYIHQDFEFDPWALREIWQAINGYNFAERVDWKMIELLQPVDECPYKRSPTDIWKKIQEYLDWRSIEVIYGEKHPRVVVEREMLEVKSIKGEFSNAAQDLPNWLEIIRFLGNDDLRRIESIPKLEGLVEMVRAERLTSWVLCTIHDTPKVSKDDRLKRLVTSNYETTIAAGKQKLLRAVEKKGEYWCGAYLILDKSLYGVMKCAWFKDVHGKTMNKPICTSRPGFRLFGSERQIVEHFCTFAGIDYSDSKESKRGENWLSKDRKVYFSHASWVDVYGEYREHIEIYGERGRVKWLVSWLNRLWLGNLLFDEEKISRSNKEWLRDGAVFLCDSSWYKLDDKCDYDGRRGNPGRCNLHSVAPAPRAGSNTNRMYIRPNRNPFRNRISIHKAKSPIEAKSPIDNVLDELRRPPPNFADRGYLGSLWSKCCKGHGKFTAIKTVEDEFFDVDEKSLWLKILRYLDGASLRTISKEVSKLEITVGMVMAEQQTCQSYWRIRKCGFAQNMRQSTWHGTNTSGPNTVRDPPYAVPVDLTERSQMIRKVEILGYFWCAASGSAKLLLESDMIFEYFRDGYRGRCFQHRGRKRSEHSERSDANCYNHRVWYSNDGKVCLICEYPFTGRMEIFGRRQSVMWLVSRLNEDSGRTKKMNLCNWDLGWGD